MSEDWTERFPRMKPVKSPPSMMTINGVGTSLYGKRDYDAETGTYVATLFIVVLFIPIFGLASYRVANAPSGGWYFIGREPLSRFVKIWNLMPALAFLGLVLSIALAPGKPTPQQLARKQMETAANHAAAGQFGDAAVIYRQLAIAHSHEAGNAVTELNKLLNGTCESCPLPECAKVYESAVAVSRARSVIGKDWLVDHAVKQVERRGDADPKGAIALLDTVSPLVIDTQPIDKLRLPLLRKIVAAEPGNLEVVAALAKILFTQEKTAEAKALLLPLRDKLGDGEGARVLGSILAREGDFDGAESLLLPYVTARLDSLRLAEQNAEDTFSRVKDRELSNLQQDSSFKARYAAASEDEQRTMVQEHVFAAVRADREYLDAQAALSRSADVVPVAMELGIVMLQRGQAEADSAVRKKRLEGAEKIFLGISGVAGESSTYRLSLGQVYFWLGRQADGRKLFDELLSDEKRSAESLISVASRLRSLGADPDARKLSEEAYNKTSVEEEKFEAANLRALASKDLDDRIVWLKRCNQKVETIRATLAKAQAERATELGRLSEAATQYQQCIDIFAAMPRSAGTLNEQALAYWGLFRCTGDRAHLEKSSDYFQQAVDLSPRDAVLIYNAGVTLMDGSLGDIASSQLDLRKLQEDGGLPLLSYLYEDEAGKSAVIARMKSHPGLNKAIGLLDSVTILSPKNSRAFGALTALHLFMRNEQAMVALAARAKAADIDVSDSLAHALEKLGTTKDAERQSATRASITRQEQIVAVCRPVGGRTASVALIDLANLKSDEIVAARGGSDLPSIQQAVTLANEALSFSRSSATVASLSQLTMLQLIAELRRDDAGFDRHMAQYERALGSTRVLLLAAKSGPYRQKILAHPLFRRCVADQRDSLQRFPVAPSIVEWALLDVAGDPLAERAASVIRESKLLLASQELVARMSPSAAVSIDTYWHYMLLGRNADANAALQAAISRGFPMPVQP